MGAWADLQDCLIAELSTVINAVVKTHKNELNEAVTASLFGDAPPNGVTRTPTRRELYVRRIFDGYLEIHSSFEALKDIETYIGRFPFSESRVSKQSYLKFHIAAYFNEVYILKTRLLTFLTRTGREFRRDRRHPEVLAATRPLFDLVNRSLEGVVNTRGQHVHQRRFSDKDLDRLESLSLLSGPANKRNDKLRKLLTPYYNSEYRRIRSSWKAQVKGNNETLDKLLDMYAEGLNVVLLDKPHRRFVYPSPLRAT